MRILILVSVHRSCNEPCRHSLDETPEPLVRQLRLVERPHDNAN